MNLILSIVTVIISIVGAVVLWLAFLDDDLNWVNGGIWFACMVIPGIINDMYEDNLRTKYEYPNKKKKIVFEGTTYKKNTFIADNRLKGYVPSQIIFFIGCLPLIWWIITGLYSFFKSLLIDLIY
jgi:hypothetical protein